MAELTGHESALLWETLPEFAVHQRCLLRFLVSLVAGSALKSLCWTRKPVAQDLHQQGSSVSFCNEGHNHHLCKELQGPWIMLVGNTTAVLCC